MHLLLVGAWPELANQLVALPARVSLLQQPKSVDAREQEWAHRYVEVEYGEVDAAVAVAERIHHEDPVDVVVGFREFALPAVAAIARALDLPSVPGPVDTLGLDKAEVRDRIRDGAARVVRHRLCRTEQDMHEFAAEVGFPLILKPARGAGSIGVHTVRTPPGWPPPGGTRARRRTARRCWPRSWCPARSTAWRRVRPGDGTKWSR